MKLGFGIFAFALLANGQDRFTDFVNQLAQRQLAERKRMAESRAKVLRQIGGLRAVRDGRSGNRGRLLFVNG